MKFSGPLESQRLSILLEMAISREAQMWKVYVPKIQPNQDIDSSTEDTGQRQFLWLFSSGDSQNGEDYSG
uniref:Cyclin-I-like n=1 Tax=Ailuropoda melanoleuca TaxID=9646 RepID=A0A7N5P6G0_AILME